MDVNTLKRIPKGGGGQEADMKVCLQVCLALRVLAFLVILGMEKSLDVTPGSFKSRTQSSKRRWSWLGSLWQLSRRQRLGICGCEETADVLSE